MSKANGHRWRFEHGLTDPELSREACTLNHLGIVLCDVLEGVAAVREELQRLEAWERLKSREWESTAGICTDSPSW